MATVEEAYACAQIMDERRAEYQRTRDEYRKAALAFGEHLGLLKQMIIDVTASLSRDGMEAALRAVIAIQKGDEDLAYEYARAAVRCATMVESADELLFGGRARAHDKRRELATAVDAVDPDVDVNSD